LKENELYIWVHLRQVEINELKANGDISLSDFNSKSNSKSNSKETTKVENSKTIEMKTEENSEISEITESTTSINAN
jgi:hypothetical protein